MSATLREEYRQHLRHLMTMQADTDRHLAKAAPADRQAVEAKLAKTYAVVAAQPPATS